MAQVPRVPCRGGHGEGASRGGRESLTGSVVLLPLVTLGLQARSAWLIVVTAIVANSLALTLVGVVCSVCSFEYINKKLL